MSSAEPPKAAHARLCLLSSHPASHCNTTRKLDLKQQYHSSLNRLQAFWALTSENRRPGLAASRLTLQSWRCSMSCCAPLLPPSVPKFETLKPFSLTPRFDILHFVPLALSVQGCDARTAPPASPPDAPGASETWNDRSASPQVSSRRPQPPLVAFLTHATILGPPMMHAFAHSSNISHGRVLAPRNISILRHEKQSGA